MRSVLECKQLCVDSKASKPADGRGRYEAGQRRCNTCGVFFDTANMHCQCCGTKLRTKPRSKAGKERLANVHSGPAATAAETAAPNPAKTKPASAPKPKRAAKAPGSKPQKGRSGAAPTTTTTAATAKSATAVATARGPNLGGMDWGIANRMASIIRPEDNRALMLAVDHGYFLGPTERLEEPDRVIAPLLEYCDSLMLTRGVQRTSVPPTTRTPMVLRVSGGSSIIGEDLSQEDVTVSIQDAIRLNASALALSIFVGSKYEYQTIANLGRLVGQAQEYGIPVLAVTAVGKELGKDARYLSLACRIAAEQGAHIVKTYYCEDFEKVTRSCPVPIIVAGGKKIPERDALELTYNSIRGGAVGVDMGRNIWQSDHPVAMIRAVRSIVHGTNDVDRAYRMYLDLAKSG